MHGPTEASTLPCPIFTTNLYAAGGGNGWGSPQWGAACDSVVRMRAVIMRTEQGVSGHKQEGQQQEEEVQEAGLPDVCVVEVDAQQQPELFCGLCGGGEGWQRDS